MSAPSVSVAIPVRNGMPYLPQAVESVLADLPPDGELVIRNNQSTDGTGEWLATLTDPRIRVLEAEGDDAQWTNFTEVCQAARGEWIKFLCADDYLLPGGLTRLLTAAVARTWCSWRPSGRWSLRAAGLC